MNDQLQRQFADIEQQYGLPAGYLSLTGQIESGLNPQSHNELSGADGYFQIVPKTAKEYGLRYGKDTRDPIKSATAAAALAKNNAIAIEQALGRPPTAGELYLAHQQGANGAISLLSNPDVAAGRVVNPRAISANGGNPNLPASQFVNKWTQPFAGLGAARSNVAPEKYGTSEDPLMVEFGATGKIVPSSDKPLGWYGTDKDPLMAEFASPQEASSSKEQGRVKQASVGQPDSQPAEAVTPNKRVQEGFEAGDYTADPGQDKFNKMMNFIVKHPTDPYSLDQIAGILGLMGAKPGLVAKGVAAGAPIAGALAGSLLKGGMLMKGAEMASGTTYDKMLQLLHAAGH